MQTIATQECPVVSVVMSSYNGAAFIEEQIASILSQSVGQIELIIVDDCSTDDSPRIIREAASADRRIRHYTNERNLGVNATIEKGLREAQADYIAIADQDDLWERGKLAALLRDIDGHQAVYSDSLLIDDQSQSLQKTLQQALGVTRPIQGHEPLALISKNTVAGHALLLNRQIAMLALPLSRLKHVFYDHQLAIVAMLNGSLGFVPQPLTLHRIHSHNQMHGALNGRNKKSKARSVRPRRFLQACQAIAFILDHIERNHAHYADNHEVGRLAAQLQKLHARMTGAHARWFDLGLFLTLLPMRKGLFSGSRRKPVAYCFSWAKGRRRN